MNKVFCLIISYLSVFAVYSQSKRTITVVESESKAPVPFAHIYLEDGSFGVLTDENGAASIDLANLKSDTSALIFSSVGYKTKSMAIEDLSDGENRIDLEPNSVMLSGVVVFSKPLTQKGVQRMVRRAVKSLKKTVPAYTAHGEYRQSIQQNGLTTYNYLSQFVLRDKFGMGKLGNPVQVEEQVDFQNLVETYDYTSRRQYYERSYYDTYSSKRNLLLWNPLKYELVKKDHLFLLTDTLDRQGKMTFVVNALHLDTARYGLDVPFREGFDLTYYLSINEGGKSDWQIDRVEVKYRFAEQHEKVSILESSTWSMDLMHTNELTFPAKISMQTNQRYMYSNSSPNLDLSSTYSMVFKESVVGDQSAVIPDKIDFTIPEKSISDFRKSPFYRTETGYLDDLATELDNEELELRKVQSLVSRGDRTKYLIVWGEDQQVPLAYYSFLSENQLVGVDDLIFISNNKDRKDWLFLVTGNFYDHFYQFRLPTLYRKVLEEYCPQQEVPYFVKIEPDGKAECSKAPFLISEESFESKK